MSWVIVVEDGQNTVVYTTDSEMEVSLFPAKAEIYDKPEWWDKCSKDFWIVLCRSYGGCSLGQAQHLTLKQNASKR